MALARTSLLSDQDIADVRYDLNYAIRVPTGAPNIGASF